MTTRRTETEVAIVGSGAAGATIARELSRKGIKVALIEKGPLKTEVAGPYVCDASVIPRSAGVPLVLILVSLARWFARSLMRREES